MEAGIVIQPSPNAAAAVDISVRYFSRISRNCHESLNKFKLFAHFLKWMGIEWDKTCFMIYEINEKIEN